MAGGGENSRRVKLKSLLMSGIHSFDVAHWCPDVFLNACAGGWMVEVWLWIVAGDPSES